MKRRILPILLSAALAFAAPMTTFAAEPTNSSTAESMTPEQAAAVTHSYKAYQIFKADVKAGKLVDIEWADNITDEIKAAITSNVTPVERDINLDAILDADGNTKVIANPSAYDYAREIDANDPGTFVTTKKAGVGADVLAQAVAAAIKQNNSAVGFDVTGTKNNYTISGTTGWYLVVDTTEGLNDEYSVYVDRAQLQVFIAGGNLQINAKHTTIEIDKEVKDINDSISVEYDGWSKSADHDVDDWIPFQISGTIPDNWDDYETFTYTFEDVQSEGLLMTEEHNASTLKIYVSRNDVYVKDVKNEFTTVIGDNGHSFTISCPNLKADTDIQAGDKIVVEYESQLTGDNVVYGYDGNPNHARIKFSNDVVGDGSTPWDIAIVFTYKPVVDKVKQDLTALQGASFKLEKLKKGADGDEDNWEVISREEIDGTALSKFEFKGIDDGYYRITETKTPEGYNSIDPIYFVVEAVHEGIPNKLVSLTVKNLKGEVLGTSITDNSIVSLGTFDVTTTDGIKTQVINQEGVVLPSTGGIGTTIFYVIGGVLVVGAVVLLIVRRRMKTEEE